MTDERIRVTSYSGCRAEETPRAFFLDDREIMITEVLDRWIEEGLNDRSRRRFFRLRGGDGSIYEIYLDEQAQEWRARSR